MRLFKKLAPAILAVLLAAALPLSATAAWVLESAEYDENGNITSGTLTFSNGGEKFDKDALTWASIPQWKIDLINAQTLNPRTTGYAELDQLVQQRLDKILTPGMTNAQKLVAIYNDIVANSVYDVPIYGNASDSGLDPWTNNPPRTYLMSYTDCVYGTYLLRYNRGACDEFSAAFVAMANAAGFEAYDFEGQINGNGHGWSVIRLGDAYYIFDTQAEQVNIKSNHVRYMNFCTKTTDTTAYTPVEGCLEKQKAYRANGYAPSSSSVIGNDAEANALLQELIAYGESLELDYMGRGERVYVSAMASSYSSRQALVSDFQKQLDQIISHTKDANGNWWYETSDYYLDGNNIRLTNGDGICGQVDSRGRPSGGYLSFGLEVTQAQSGNGDYLITLYV